MSKESTRRLIFIICLMCKEEISRQASWTSLLLRAENVTCAPCFQGLKKITGSVCPICCRPQDAETLCFDCERWEADPVWKGVLTKNSSVFQYTDAMKEILSAFKFRGDAALVNVFKQTFVESYQNQLASLSFDAAAPIPLSAERLYERGFNQAKLLTDFLPLPQLDVLKRTHHEKQSKKSRTERLASTNMFSVIAPNKIANKRIVLVDDIYTTGSTLRHASKLLLQNGAASVSSLTLIRS